ncbi:hypothetical protein EMIT0194MI4_80232 [Pseudomonas sp. IT-194MI4]
MQDLGMLRSPEGASSLATKSGLMAILLFSLTIKKTIGDTPSWLWIYSSYSSTPPRC